MADAPTNRPLQAELDFGKLLGFKHLAIFAGEDTDPTVLTNELAHSLGSTWNKVGTEGPL